MELTSREQCESNLKRDTTDVSEEIVKILSAENYSALEQKEILNNVRNYFIEEYSEKRDAADKEMQFYKMEIDNICSK